MTICSSDQENCIDTNATSSQTATTAIQTELTSEELGDIVCSYEKLKTDYELLQSRFTKLEKDRNVLNMKFKEFQEKARSLSFDQESFIENDEKVLFYTGLSTWNLLLTLFQFVKPSITSLNHSSLSPFQLLLLTLMRLRLSLSGKDLGYRFGIHPSTVSRIFYNVLSVLFNRLKFLIVWPDRDTLKQTLPMDFRKHCPSCTVIIDCFEIFIDRPSDLLARAQTYSHYKNHNTAKYLIGIVPQGSICFISNGWGGRVSDKFITENCGILNKINPGDTILADRGFNIKETIGIFCATVKIPAFTKGKKQLAGIDVEQTRGIANLRIHVERVIGNLRSKYTFLSDVQPIDYLTCKNDEPTILDMAVTVSSCLCNLCDSVVPFD